jgi:hypothetical protein
VNAHLFAAAGDWISMLIPIVVAIIWVLNQVFSNLAQKPNRPEARRPNAPPRAPQNPRVNEEIEKFLRRAAQQQQQQQQPQQRAAQQRGRAEQRPAVPARTAPRTLVQQEPFKRPAPTVPATLVEVEMVDEGPAIRGKDVDDHVEKYFRSSQFTERALTPLSKVDQADEMMESHLHKMFDRQLGSLASTTSTTPAAATPPPPSTMATPGGIAALLRDPRNLRSAIILQEILSPPESRW